MVRTARSLLSDACEIRSRRLTFGEWARILGDLISTYVRVTDPIDERIRDYCISRDRIDRTARHPERSGVLPNRVRGRRGAHRGCRVAARTVRRARRSGGAAFRAAIDPVQGHLPARAERSRLSRASAPRPARSPSRQANRRRRDAHRARPIPLCRDDARRARTHFSLVRFSRSANRRSARTVGGDSRAAVHSCAAMSTRQRSIT